MIAVDQAESQRPALPHRLRGVAQRAASGLCRAWSAIRRWAGTALGALALGAACQPAPPEARSVDVPAPSAVAAAIPQEDPGPRRIGDFNITFYYVVGEEEVAARRARRAPPTRPAGGEVAASPAGAAADLEGAAAPSGEAPGSAAAAGVGTADADRADEGAGSAVTLAAAAPAATVTLYAAGAGCEPIAETSREFAAELNMQGTGKLRDGRVVNVWGRCRCPTSPCWKVTKQQWGTSGSGRPLQPFRTVAVDPKVVKLGSLLHIPLLEGRVMPGRPPWGGFVHDGCVVADDTGGAIRNHRLDLFVGRRGWFLGMSGRPGRTSWARQVPVFDGAQRCERNGREVGRRSGAS
jgi:3D (Asp-Asp-Asp) domain-containing protein